MLPSELIAVESWEQAGAIVFWKMSGNVDLDDLREAAAAEGIDEKILPGAPSVDTVLLRSAQACITDKRQLIRPLDHRGEWVLETESVVFDGTRKKLAYVEHVRLRVAREGNEKKPVIEAVEPGDLPLAEAIAGQMSLYSGLLTTTDMSNWILNVLGSEVHAIALREKGGFYFVPKDRLDVWRSYVRVVAACSGHRIYELPAMRSEAAVEAILTAVRAEAQTRLDAFESYCAGTVSTRGLNSVERALAKVIDKLAHYSDLLGIQLPDLTEKAVTAAGALAAARIKKEAVNVGHLA